MTLFQHKRFPTPDYVPDGKHDGTGCCVDGETYIYEDCVIDMIRYGLDEMDEAVGITWGASMLSLHCLVNLKMFYFSGIFFQTPRNMGSNSY